VTGANVIGEKGAQFGLEMELDLVLLLRGGGAWGIGSEFAGMLVLVER
jgi:hypothetical protein